MNNSHREVVKEFVISKNSDNLSYFIEGIGFKKDSDILTESTRLYLIEDLLIENKNVYIKKVFDSNNEKILELDSKYKTLTIVENINEIEEKLFVIEY